MVDAPFKIPKVLIPAIACPMINIIGDLVTPQIKDPNSKRADNATKSHSIKGVRS
jgi:hypothetical protein